MKLLISAIMLSLSASSFAGCLVELSGVNTSPFSGNSCRDALRECNKFKRQNGMSHARCQIIDRNYNGGYSGGGYGGGSGHTGGNPPSNQGDIVRDFIDGYSRNCRVLPNIDGYHQVYVDGTFRGNYSPYNLSALRRVLRSYVRNGSCDYSLAGNQSDPTVGIVQDLIQNRYRNCYIQPNVNGIYHQVYVNGTFRGNYDVRVYSDMYKLKEFALNLMRNRTCYR